MTVWRNGAFAAPGNAVSAADRGYLVGDGVFETMLVRDGRPAFLGAHLSRLQRGAERLEMKNAIDEEGCRRAIAGLASRLGLTGEAVCRLTVTRCGGARGLAPSNNASIETMISLHPATAPKTHYRLIIAQPRRLSDAPTNGFKCVGAYAANMLARLEAMRAGADEALLLNEYGRVCCASSANIILFSGDSLVTPPESEGALPGVTRAILLDAASEIGVEVRLEPILLFALNSATDLLLTNSVIGAARASMIGSDAPQSALASCLAEAYQRKLDKEFARRPA